MSLSVDLRGLPITYQDTRDPTASDPKVVLPYDVWDKIRHYFNFSDYVRCSRVSHSWHKYIDDTKIFEVVAARFNINVHDGAKYKKQLSQKISSELYQAIQADSLRYLPENSDFPTNSGINGLFYSQVRLCGLGIYEFKDIEKLMNFWDQKLATQNRDSNFDFSTICSILLRHDLIDEALYVFEKFKNRNNLDFVYQLIRCYAEKSKIEDAILWYNLHSKELFSSDNLENLSKILFNKAIELKRCDIAINLLVSIETLEKDFEDSNDKSVTRNITEDSVILIISKEKHSIEIRQFFLENPRFLFNTLKYYCELNKTSLINFILNYIVNISPDTQEVKQYLSINLPLVCLSDLKPVISIYCAHEWLDEAVGLTNTYLSPERNYESEDNVKERDFIVNTLFEPAERKERWDIIQYLILLTAKYPTHITAKLVGNCIKFRENKDLIDFFSLNPQTLSSVLEYWLKEREALVNIPTTQEIPYLYESRTRLLGSDELLKYSSHYGKKGLLNIPEIEKEIYNICSYILDNFGDEYLISKITPQYLPKIGLLLLKKQSCIPSQIALQIFELILDKIPNIDENAICYSLEEGIHQTIRKRLINQCSKISSQTISCALNRKISEEIVLLLLDKCESIDVVTLHDAFDQELSESMMKNFLDKCPPTQAISLMIKLRSCIFLIIP